MNIITGVPKIAPFGFTDNTVGRHTKVACISGDGDTFAWTVNGHPVKHGHDGITLQQSPDMLVLSISNLRPTHSGNYTCTVRNHEGVSSYSALLEVAAPPEWKVRPQDIVILDNTRTSIHCEAIGYPEPNITWHLKDGS